MFLDIHCESNKEYITENEAFIQRGTVRNKFLFLVEFMVGSWSAICDTQKQLMMSMLNDQRRVSTFKLDQFDRILERFTHEVDNKAFWVDIGSEGIFEMRQSEPLDSFDVVFRVEFHFEHLGKIKKWRLYRVISLQCP